MANINTRWKKFLAVGCSHGSWADTAATKAVLEFADRFKPDLRIHLGDYTDSTAWRSGASAKDRAENFMEDLNSATTFLEEYRPDILFNGNHDIRLWKALEDPGTVSVFAATAAIKQIKEALPKNCHHIESYNMEESYLVLGDTTWSHGFMFNENAVRDHAEHYGTKNTVIAHLHTAVIQPGRGANHPVGYCVGYLGENKKFSYAHTRRATSRWSHGFAWGEYNDKQFNIRLERNEEGIEWRTPRV